MGGSGTLSCRIETSFLAGKASAGAACHLQATAAGLAHGVVAVEVLVRVSQSPETLHYVQMTAAYEAPCLGTLDTVADSHSNGRYLPLMDCCAWVGDSRTGWVAE